MIRGLLVVLSICFLCVNPLGCIAVHEQGASVANQPGPPPWAPAHGYRAKHHYYYYPDARVYYDAGRKVYFYPVNGDWNMSAALPAGIQINRRDYTVLDMDTDKPYKYHSEVAKNYPPGQLKKMEKGKGTK